MEQKNYEGSEADPLLDKIEEKYFVSCVTDSLIKELERNQAVGWLHGARSVQVTAHVALDDETESPDSIAIRLRLPNQSMVDSDVVLGHFDLEDMLLEDADYVDDDEKEEYREYCLKMAMALEALAKRIRDR